MAKRRRHIPHIGPKHRHPRARSTFILLDQFSITDIQKWTAFKDQLLKYHWDYYNELAYQRSQIADEINKSLLEATQKSFSFEKWQRAVKYKYSLEPFSVIGSLTDTAGIAFVRQGGRIWGAVRPWSERIKVAPCGPGIHYRNIWLPARLWYDAVEISQCCEKGRLNSKEIGAVPNY